MRTPRNRIVGELRRLFVKSVERSEALKRDNYTCCICKRKQSKKKGFELAIHVHHINEIDWDNIIDLIQDRLLCDSDMLQTLCIDCHKEITYQ